MATSLTDAAASRMCNWLTLNSTTAPTTGLKVRLMTANGSSSSAGTEVVGGSYASQTVAFGSSSTGSTVAATADVVFTGMPACTVVGFEIWDQNGTPFRWFYDTALTGGNVTVNSGDTFTLTAASLTIDPTP